MGMFDVVYFGPQDVKAVKDGTATTRQVIAILTSQTCGEACWHAKDEICRCSCGGKNHGCLKTPDGVKPERTAKIGGERYVLVAVGEHRTLIEDAEELNRLAGYRCICEPEVLFDNTGQHDPTEAQIAEARVKGVEVQWHQYRYHWDYCKDGSPARLKFATKSQIAKWEELKAWRYMDDREVHHKGISLLWKLVNMPVRPTTLLVDRATGIPLPEDQQLPPKKG